MTILYYIDFTLSVFFKIIFIPENIISIGSIKNYPIT